MAKAPAKRKRKLGRVGVTGRPPFVPTAAQRQAVMGLVSIGTEHWVIAHILQISDPTLQKYFREELEKGRGLVHAQIGGGLVAAALAGNLTAQIFYSKAQMGWRDRYNVGFDDERGKPVNPSNLFTIKLEG